MTGYISTKIDFDALQKDLNSAIALDTAGRTDTAKEILMSMKTKLEEESK